MHRRLMPLYIDGYQPSSIACQAQCSRREVIKMRNVQCLLLTDNPTRLEHRCIRLPAPIAILKGVAERKPDYLHAPGHDSQ